MIIPTFVMERPVMWRERASKLYSVLPWVESMQDVEIPWIALQTLINSLISYFMIQFEFEAGKFFFYWLVQFLSCATLGYLGMLVVCITPDLTMAVTIGSSILGAWFMMSGAHRCKLARCRGCAVRHPAYVLGMGCNERGGCGAGAAAGIGCGCGV